MISEGDLRQTIEVRRRDEIGLLGDTINELTVNIQEIVAHGLAMELSLSSSVQRLCARQEDDPASRKQLDEIAGRLSGFKDFLEAFKLFTPSRASTEVEEKR